MTEREGVYLVPPAAPRQVRTVDWLAVLLPVIVILAMTVGFYFVLGSVTDQLSAAECRARFANEEARITGRKLDVYLDAITASVYAPGRELFILAGQYADELQPLADDATRERIASPTVCRHHPDAQPTLRVLPPSPFD